MWAVFRALGRRAALACISFSRRRWAAGAPLGWGEMGLSPTHSFHSKDGELNTEIMEWLNLHGLRAVQSPVLTLSKERRETVGPDCSKTTFLEQDLNRNNLLCGSRPWVHVCQHVAYNLRDSKFPRSLCMDEHHVKKSYSIYAEVSLKSLFRSYLIQDKYQLYLFRTQLAVYDTFIFYVHTCIHAWLFCLCFVSFFKQNVRATTHMTVL